MESNRNKCLDPDEMMQYLRDYAAVKGEPMMADAADMIEKYYESWQNGNRQIAHYQDEARKRQWISVEDRMPPERDSMFAKLYGTERWRMGMFRRTSDAVNVVIRLADGKKIVRTTHTLDGKWESISCGAIEETVTHWQPMPKPTEGQNND